MNGRDRIWILVARKWVGEATEEELKELEQWQRQHPDDVYTLQILDDLVKTQRPPDPTAAEQAFDKHLVRLEEHSARAQEPSTSPQTPPFRPRNTRTRTRQPDIFRNYMLVAWRSFSRNKIFSALNVSGLAIGIASAVLLLLWIWNEVSADRFHANGDRIYSVMTRSVINGRIECWGATPMVLGPVLQSACPQQIEQVVRTNWVGAFILSSGDQHLQTYGYLTDPGFLTLFSFPLIRGDAKTDLNSPHSIVLTACINYMNLGTARSIRRAKEVGIRKMIGAGKGSLVGRFIGESVLTAFLAGLVALAIYKQISFIRHRDIGYNQDHLVFAWMKGDVKKRFEYIRGELLSSGAATAVIRTNSPVTDIWSSSDDYAWSGKKTGARNSFIEFYSDHRVIHDFVTGTPFYPISPVVIKGPIAQSGNDWFGTVTCKLNDRLPMNASTEKMTAIFKKYNPDYPFEYHFIDDFYAEKFDSQKKAGSLAAWFAGLSIFISCLGLFGLAAYTSENRIKEVGIRKVLGACILQIASLLSREFLVLILVAFAIAAPIAWWYMNYWLSDYPYRVGITWWIYALAGALTALIAACTIGIQATRAAMTRPVDTLRTE